MIFVLFSLTSLFTVMGCQRSSDSQGQKRQVNLSSPKIRESIIAGSWYPGEPDELSNVVDGFLDNVPAGEVEGELVAVIVPHAGYRFSGSVAAHAHAVLKDRGLRTVVVIGPSHRYSFRGFSVYQGEGYETPFGVVPIQTRLAQDIISSHELVSFVPEAHQAEHCIEIQLPFLQRILKTFDFVPLVIGPQTTVDDCLVLAENLTELLRNRDDVVLMASSDMSHYASYDEAVRVDHEMLSVIKRYDIPQILQRNSELLREGIPNLSCTFCGLKAVLLTLLTAQGLGANSVDILKYANSGDTPYGERNSVVGYGAIAVYKSESSSKKIEFEPLDQDAQQMLLRLAREAIESFVNTGRAPEPGPELPVFHEKRGVFVTITKHGQLRGCIGYHGNDIPLYKLVPDRAIAAAVRDTRFPPLSPEELKDIRIKVSVYLSNVYQIDDLEEFELGKHGILLRKGNRGATFLPEVPIEAGWTKEEEMEHLCRKAGLPSGAWREGADLYVYATQVFGEK
jgi:AmmeMemoRadiSam system protein B/AmmeMemoRadiSam system protein A